MVDDDDKMVADDDAYSIVYDAILNSRQRVRSTEDFQHRQAYISQWLFY